MRRIDKIQEFMNLASHEGDDKAWEEWATEKKIYQAECYHPTERLIFSHINVWESEWYDSVFIEAGQHTYHKCTRCDKVFTDEG